MYRRDEEYVDPHTDRLRVPVPNAMDPAPKRDGWQPWFVSVLLDDPIQKVVSYRRIPTEAAPR